MVTTHRKDSMKDREDPTKDRKDPAKDRKGFFAIRKICVEK